MSDLISPPKPLATQDVIIRDDQKASRVICLPVDESKASVHALEWALTHLQLDKEKDKILLIHARPSPSSLDSLGRGVDPLMPYAFETMYEDAAKFEEHSKDQSKTLVLNLSKRVSKLGYRVHAVSVEGDNVRSCLEAKINEMKPTFVVMGNRGLGPVSQVFLGSVSQHLLYHSLSPVLMIPFHEPPGSIAQDP